MAWSAVLLRATSSNALGSGILQGLVPFGFAEGAVGLPHERFGEAVGVLDEVERVNWPFTQRAPFVGGAVHGGLGADDRGRPWS